MTPTEIPSPQIYANDLIYANYKSDVDIVKCVCDDRIITMKGANLPSCVVAKLKEGDSLIYGNSIKIWTLVTIEDSFILSLRNNEDDLKKVDIRETRVFIASDREIHAQRRAERY